MHRRQVSDERGERERKIRKRSRVENREWREKRREEREKRGGEKENETHSTVCKRTYPSIVYFRDSMLSLGLSP